MSSLALPLVGAEEFASLTLALVRPKLVAVLVSGDAPLAAVGVELPDSLWLSEKDVAAEGAEGMADMKIEVEAGLVDISDRRRADVVAGLVLCNVDVCTSFGDVVVVLSPC